MNYAKPLQLFEHLVKTKGIDRGRLLCFVLREEHVGLAISGPKNQHASPLTALSWDTKDYDYMQDQFQDLIYEHNLAGFVVGTSCYGENEDKKAKDFLAGLYDTRSGLLKNYLDGIKYTFWDKSQSSKHVEFVNRERVDMVLKRLNLSHIEPQTILDQFVAVGVLKGYLDHAWETYEGAKELLEKEPLEKEPQATEEDKSPLF